MTAAWDQRDVSEQGRVRDRLLAAWLPGVVAAAPYWTQVSDRLGMGAEQARDLAAIRGLGTVTEIQVRSADGPGASAVVAPTEQQVKAHAPASMLRRLAAAIGRDGPVGKRDVLLREYRPLQLQRAGTDGRFWVASSRSDLDRMHRGGARTAAVLGLTDDDVLVSAVRNAPDLAHLGTLHLAMGASLTAVHPRTTDGFDEVIAAVRALQPSVLIVSVTEVAHLGRALADGDAVPPGLRAVVVLGPSPDEEARAGMARAFAADGAVEVRAAWAPPESRVLWAECAAGSGLHTYPDLELLEVVDPLTAEPVADGADGELVLTSLGWHGTALVRFRTGVRVDGLTTEPCPACGRTLPRLTGGVEPAAWQLPYAASDRVGTADLRGIATVLTRTPGVLDWRVELRRDQGGDDLLHVEVAGDVSEEPYDLQNRLAQACGMVPEVELDVPAAEVAAGVARVGGIFADLR